MTDQADIKARAREIFHANGCHSPGSKEVAAMLAFEAERGAEREAAAYARAAEVCRQFEAMHLDLIQNRDSPTKVGIRIARQFAHARHAIMALGEAKG